MFVIIKVMDTNENQSLILEAVQDNGVSKNPVTKFFLLLVIPLSLIITLIFYGTIAIETQFEYFSLKERELAQAQIAGHVLEFENQQPVFQLKIFSHSLTVHRFLASGSLDEKKRIIYFFTNLIDERMNYDHTIFLDNFGNEIIRIDRINGIPVVKDNLNNESKEDYFRNTIKLSKGQIYISPLTINSSLTKHVTTIIFGTPVFDDKNNKRGVVIFSLNGEKLLNDFKTAMLGNKHTALLINNNGIWVNADGYISPDDIISDLNFAKLYPEQWYAIKEEQSGSIETKLGLFTFTTVYPLISSNENLRETNFESNDGMKGKDYFWKIVSFIPNTDLPYTSLRRHHTIFSIYLFSLCIIAGISLFLARLLANKQYNDKKFHRYTEQINDLYENAPIGYHSIDDKGIYIHINTTELNWLGYTREEVIGKMHVTDFLTPTGLRLFNESFPKFKERGFINDLEFEFVRKNGTKFIGLVNATAIYDENHKYLMSRTTMVDITKRKKIEYALRESEERFRNAMDNAPIGMAIISPDGILTRINETLAKLLAYEKIELEQLNIDDITNPDDLNLDVQQCHDLIAGKISHYKIEKRLIRKDNVLVWVQLTYSIVKDSTNQPLYYIAQIEDISERKQYQESVHHLAYHDTLTNLPNRRLLHDKLDRTIEKARISHQALAVIYVDLDNFKSINDTLGHEIGDELLKVIAARLSDEVRDTDIVSRTGGDEFIILLTKVSSEKDAELIANSLINTIRSPIFIREHKLKMTVSIGIAIFPRDGKNAKLLMRSADRAMYAAKNAGKDQYFSSTDHQPTETEESKN